MAESSSSSSSPTEEIVRLIKRLSAYVAFKMSSLFSTTSIRNLLAGEALSMYGKLIWETKRDEKRAQGYFDQAVNASPHDCMVLGSYAHFMWEAEDDDDDEEEEVLMAASPAMVSAV